MLFLIWKLVFWVNLLVNFYMIKFSNFAFIFNLYCLYIQSLPLYLSELTLDTGNTLKWRKPFALCWEFVCRFMLSNVDFSDCGNISESCCAQISVLAVHSCALIKMEIGIVSVTLVLCAWQPMCRPRGVGLAQERLEDQWQEKAGPHVHSLLQVPLFELRWWLWP